MALELCENQIIIGWRRWIANGVPAAQNIGNTYARENDLYIRCDYDVNVSAADAIFLFVRGAWRLLASEYDLTLLQECPRVKRCSHFRIGERHLVAAYADPTQIVGTSAACQVVAKTGDLYVGVVDEVAYLWIYFDNEWHPFNINPGPTAALCAEKPVLSTRTVVGPRYLDSNRCEKFVIKKDDLLVRCDTEGTEPSLFVATESTNKFYNAADETLRPIQFPLGGG